MKWRGESLRARPGWGGWRAEEKLVAQDMAGSRRRGQMTGLWVPAGSRGFLWATEGGVRGAEIVARCRDPPAADADVAAERVRRGRDRAAADDGVEVHMRCSSIVCSFFFTRTGSFPRRNFRPRFVQFNAFPKVRDTAPTF